MTTDQTMREQAVHWAVRTGDPAFADWEEFTRWLEADPAHARAYDAVVAAVDEVTEAGLPAAPANDDAAEEPAYRPLVPRRAWLGGAIAASLALVGVIGLFGAGGTTDYVTAPGEMRTIALEDGSSITLSGDTRLSLKGERLAMLEQGVALFDLRHDAGAPFEVRAGDDVLRDIGTVFEVRRSADATSVAVSEGAVLFNPARQARRVDPGQSLVHRSGRVEVSNLPVALVGEWREGRHTFRDASLAEVAADLSRASGLRFAASPQAGGRRVSGSVLVEPIRKDPGSLGPLLGVSVRRDGDVWTLDP